MEGDDDHGRGLRFLDPHQRDGRPPILEAFRLASRGALHPPVGLALLAEHGHPDAVECVISELGAVPSSVAPSS